MEIAINNLSITDENVKPIRSTALIICSTWKEFDFFYSLKMNGDTLPFVVMMSDDITEILGFVNKQMIDTLYFSLNGFTQEEVLKLVRFTNLLSINAIVLSNQMSNFQLPKNLKHCFVCPFPETTSDLQSVLITSRLIFKKDSKKNDVSKLAITDEKIASKDKSSVQSNFIAVPHLNTIQLIKKDQIIHLNSNGKYTLFHLENKNVIVSSRNLGEYEKDLINDKNFIRVHHSHIINLDYLSIIDKEQGWCCIMNDGNIIKISRGRKEDIYARLNLKNVQVDNSEFA